MITLILTLLATLVIIAIFAAAMITIEALDRLRELLKTASLDAVQIYAAAHTARLDAESRQETLEFDALRNTAQLEYQRDMGRLMIAQQRQKLIGSVPGGA